MRSKTSRPSSGTACGALHDDAGEAVAMRRSAGISVDGAAAHSTSTRPSGAMATVGCGLLWSPSSSAGTSDPSCSVSGVQGARPIARGVLAGSLPETRIVGSS
jgi:hypothetical protein